jgi:hypothetical protein
LLLVKQKIGTENKNVVSFPKNWANQNSFSSREAKVGECGVDVKAKASS